MHLASLDGSAELTLTIAGYAYPNDLSDEVTANWLDVDLNVRTPHGWGTSRADIMLTWNGEQFVYWLDAIATASTELPPMWFTGGTSLDVYPFPENLAVSRRAQDPQNIRLEVYFVLELPGHWEMDDSSTEYGQHHYVGRMELMVPRAALVSAAESLRAELQRFPRRQPNI